MEKQNNLIYTLEDKPPFIESSVAALQFVLASFLSIIAPPVIIATALDLKSEIPYLMSMSLVLSGVSTYIQVKKIGAIGSGILALQGTSFGFVPVIIAGGFLAKEMGNSKDEILATLFTASFFCSFIEMGMSRYFHKLEKIVTPTVTGVVIVAIGFYLIKVGFTDMGGGFLAKKNGTFGSLSNLLLSSLVLIIIVLLQTSKNPFIRLSSIFMGILIGYIVALLVGIIDLTKADFSFNQFAFPIPFKYGFSINWSVILIISFMYIITTIETVADITAISTVSNLEIEGKNYNKRVEGGLLADGFNSALAAVFNSFPNTTFSQGAGIVHMTGVASRHVGIFISVTLVILGLLPGTGALFNLMPRAVFGGALLVLFATIAVSGIKILAEQSFSRRNVLIIAISLGLGLGVTLVPDILSQMPNMVKKLFSSSVTTSGIIAIILNIILPPMNR